MNRRLLIAGVIFLMAAGAIARATKTEPVLIRQPLESFPYQIGAWRGAPGTPFDNKVLAILGVDDYITRIYGRGSDGVGLYIGYYRSQREGDAVHSPLNCLPGAGWQPVKQSRLRIAVPDAPGEIEVNRFVIQKGLDKQLVLYWYQSQGRVIASEYSSKMFMVWDSIRHQRTDAALVRVIVPLNDQMADAEAVAERAAVDFVDGMFPLLSAYLPR